MPDRSRKKRPTDLNSLAASIVSGAVDKDTTPADDGKDPAAVSLGRGADSRAAKPGRQSSARAAVRERQEGGSR
jgi:hypothetical protein